jgi:hypothetical protein
VPAAGLHSAEPIAGNSGKARQAARINQTALRVAPIDIGLLVGS